MDLKSFKSKLMKNPEFKREYKKVDFPFEMTKILIRARILKGFTQAKLAELVGTKQPSIARIERGESLPSLHLLLKIAKAYKTSLVPPTFEFLQEQPEISFKQETSHDVEFDEYFSNEYPEIIGNQLFIKTYNSAPAVSYP